MELSVYLPEELAIRTEDSAEGKLVFACNGNDD